MFYNLMAIYLMFPRTGRALKLKYFTIILIWAELWSRLLPSRKHSPERTRTQRAGAGARAGTRCNYMIIRREGWCQSVSKQSSGTINKLTFQCLCVSWEHSEKKKDCHRKILSPPDHLCVSNVGSNPRWWSDSIAPEASPSLARTDQDNTTQHTGQPLLYTRLLALHIYDPILFWYPVILRTRGQSFAAGPIVNEPRVHRRCTRYYYHFATCFFNFLEFIWANLK